MIPQAWRTERLWSIVALPAWLLKNVINPTHKRTEGRAPVWGSEFTSKRCRTTGGGSSRNRCRLNVKMWTSVTGDLWCFFTAEQQQTAAATARPVAARWKPQFKQHAKIHHYPGALPPGWVGLAGGVEARSSSNKINSGHSSSSARQGKRDKYHYEVECVTDVPIGCILNR